MLRKSMKKWLLQEKETQKSKTPSERAKLFRIRRTATKAIEDLAFLLEHLSEAELERIFSAENMSPFLRALLSLKSDSPEKRRKRVLWLWNTLFGVVSTTYGLSLVSREVWAVLASQPIPHIQAVYYASFFQEK